MKAFIFFFLAPGALLAHPVSISWATLRASKEKIGLQLNILAEDLFLYHGLEADGDGIFKADQLLEAARQHTAFLSRYFFLEDLQGRRLTGDFLRLQSDGIPPGGIHKDSLMQYSLLYFFEFKTPATLSGVQAFQQFGGDLSPIPALVMATAYQEGASGSLTAELSRERPWLLRFNWERPELFAGGKGFARFAEKEELSASICIDKAGIRQVLALPFEKLETLLPMSRQAPSRVSAVEQQEAQQKTIAFFTSRIKVMANGQPATLASAKVEFGEQDLPAATAGVPQSLLPDTPVKVSLLYATPPSLSSLSIRWEVFNWQARSWKADIRAFGKAESHTFSRYRPEYVWVNARERR